MASPEYLKKLSERLEALRSYRKETLLTRPEWGAIKFDECAGDFDRIFDIASYLRVLPVDLLTNQTINEIAESLAHAKDAIEQVNRFNIESGNPTATRNDYRNRIRDTADELFVRTAQWIPFLAYKKGDVAENISKLTNSLQDANKITDDAKESIARKSHEIEEIISKAREASAAAGAAVFTKDFERQANALRDLAAKWLTITACLAGVTLLFAVTCYYLPPTVADKYSLVMRITGKVAILGILITAVIWCGQIYKALMHQSSTYRFKALGLQTFQAFSAGAANSQTKDVVLVETTRSIFANNQTGYIENGGDGNAKIVEILKSALPGQDG